MRNAKLGQLLKEARRQKAEARIQRDTAKKLREALSALGPVGYDKKLRAESVQLVAQSKELVAKVKSQRRRRNVP